MATIFRNLFRNNKKASREETPEFSDRDSTRRSIRSASKNHRSTRFSDDNMLPATAAYHTQNAPKLRKGPQSCPGAYVEELEEVEQPRRSSRQNYKSYHHNSIAGSSSGSRRDWETSEYGSESPRHHHYQNYTRQQQGHRNHYESRLDDEDDEEEREELDYEHKKYQDLKMRYRRHYEDKLNDYECRRRDDRRRIKELEKDKQIIEKEKNDVVKIMIQQNEKMEKEKRKTEYYKRKMLEMEQQINQLRGGFAGFGVFPPATPQIFANGAFGNSSIGSGANSARFSSFLSSSIRPISSSNTPTTSAMDTSGGGAPGGAGESLVPASDLSLIQIPPMAPIIDLPQNVPTGGVIGANFANDFEDIEEDEIKNFRTAETPSMSIEMPRVSDMSEGELSFLKEKIEIRDEGYSTTPDEIVAQKS